MNSLTRPAKERGNNERRFIKMSIKTCSKLITKFVCDICREADNIKTDRNEFMKYILSQLFDLMEKKSIEKLDINEAYRNDEIIKDFIVTGEAILQAANEDSGEDKESSMGIAVLQALRSDGKKLEISIKYKEGD